MKLNSYIDHTLLKPTARAEEIEQLCNEAIQYQFAAVCIPPYYIKKAKAALQNTSIKTATVIGFPFGYSAVQAKKAEMKIAIENKADELDVVINLLALKNNDWNYLSVEAEELIDTVKQASKIIKIIIETGVLTDDEIKKCCELYGGMNADFLKTSTGYAEKGATVEAVRLLRENLPSHIQVKASGGIRSYEFAKQLIEAGARRLGCSASVAIVQQEQNIQSAY